MKRSFRTFKAQEQYKGFIILVYGEVWEEGYIDGIVLKRAKYTRDGREVLDVSKNDESILLTRPYTRTRLFNMGWAICNPADKFDEERGIELCKKRFRKTPLKAETGLFLTKDMCRAIVHNEVEYIKAHWDKFNPDYWNKLAAVRPLTDSEPCEAKCKCCDINPDAACPCEDEDMEKVSKKLVEEDNFIEPKAEKIVTEAELGKGIFVTIDDGDNEVTSVGLIRSVDSEKKQLHFEWIVRFNDNYFGLSYSYGTNTLQGEFDKVTRSTPKEIAMALKALKNNAHVTWNPKEFKFERIK